MILRSVFGAQVRHHRRAAGLTQEALAERVDVSIETIGKIERGQAAPTFDTAEAIARALNVEPVALFGVESPGGERGQMLGRIHSILGRFNEDQLARAVRVLEALT